MVGRGEEVDAFGRACVTTRSRRDTWQSGLSIEWTWKSLPTKPVVSITCSICGVDRAWWRRRVTVTFCVVERVLGPARHDDLVVARLERHGARIAARIDEERLRDAERRAVRAAVAEHAGAVVDEPSDALGVQRIGARVEADDRRLGRDGCAGLVGRRPRAGRPWPAARCSAVVGAEGGDGDRVLRRGVEPPPSYGVAVEVRRRRCSCPAAASASSCPTRR